MEPEKKQNTDLANINLDPVSFFDKDEVFVLAYKKTEKLASALYMITNLFSDNEPIKWTLRKKVADLLSFTLTYKDTAELSQNDFVYNIKTRVLELSSLLEVSFRGGLVSQMNFSVLKHEFSNLINIFSKTEISPKNPFNENISKTFFDMSRSGEVGRDSDKIYNRIDSGYPVQRTSVGEIKDKDITVAKDSFKRSNRQTLILSLFNNKKRDLSIKDITHIIKDCSEKTVQRELNSFISMGLLKRAGVRRWSRYSLA